MGFGNFRIVIAFSVFLLFVNFSVGAQQKTEVSEFLYNQLDYFLQNPTSSGSLRLSKMIASKENQLHTKADQLAWVIVHCNLGYYRNQFGSTPSAILYYEKARKTYFEKELINYDIIENCLQPLGNIYIKIGDLPKAETTIKNYLYLAEQSQNKQKIISAITNLSIAYNNQSNYSKALSILKQGFNIDPNNVNILTNLATNFLDSGNLRHAESKAKKVISLDPNQINAYQILAAISLEKEDLNTAEEYILLAKSQLLKNENTTARSLAKWHLAYIDILLSKSKFKEAQKNLKEIYTSLLPKYSEKNDLPIEEHLIADKVLLKALDVQGYVYQQTQNPLKAIEAYDLSFAVNSKLNALYPLQDTRILQQSQNRNRTETYIDILFSLYQSEKNISFIEQAFHATESSKAPIVSEALLSKKILSQYKNDSLVIEKNKLNTELSLYETLILKEKTKGNTANIEQIQKWTVNYGSKSIDLKENLEKLQKKYPVLLQTQKTINTAALQKKLQNDNTVLIEYFFGNQNIYQFEVRSDTLLIKKTANTIHVKNAFKNYIEYFDDASSILNDISQFTKSASETFNLLKIPTDAKKLLIIPDGLLCFIPFETILTEKTTALQFGKMPFLVKSTQISYEISSSKYLRASYKEKDTTTVLGIFPVFEKTDSELLFSVHESKSIQQYFSGTFLEKEQATYTNFIKKAEDYAIIHLSTHAEAGNFFKPASIKFRNQDILVNQLYALNLDTDLVVLSACETGVGKLAKGEGPISIGRGFQYAGVENVLFSLWKVNDKTTSRLMGNFYKNLNKSIPNATALHHAKLDYLNASDIANTQKSPYYWAAFVYYGNIQTSTASNFLWYLIGLVLFLLIVLLLRKHRQNKT